MYYLYIFFLFIYPLSLQAQGFLNNVDLLPKVDIEKIRNTQPDPSDLQPQWHSFFLSDSSIADERIESFAESEEKKIATFQEQDAKKARGFLERITTSLQAIIKAKNSDSAPPTPVLDIQEAYSLADLMALYKQQNQKERAISHLTVDIEELEEELDKQSLELDQMRREYLLLNEANTTKYMLGLEAMAAWTRLQANREDLIQTTQRLENTRKSNDEIHQEITIAERRLVPGKNEQELLNKTKQASQEVLFREEQFLEQETRAVAQLPNTAMGKTTRQHINQQTLLAKIQLSIAQIGQQITFMQLYLEKALNGQTITKDLFSLIESWEEKRETLQESVKDWKVDTEREYTRAFQEQLKLNQEDLNQRQLYLRNEQRLTTANASKAALNHLQNTLEEAKYLASVLEARAVTQWSELGKIGLKVEEAASSVFKGASRVITRPLFSVNEVPVTLLGILRAFFVLIASVWIARLVQKTFERMGDQQKRMASSTFYSLGRLAHYFIICLGSLLALLSLGLDLTTLALIAGALSVGIGFGLQGIVNNFLSGLIILFEGQMKVGDFLELESGARGTVTAINMRSTVLRTNKGIEVLIPNSEIVGQRTINWTMSDDYRRIHIPFGVSYNSDKDFVRKVVLEAADRVPHTVKGVARYRDPVVWLTGFGDSALNFELVVWVSSPASKSPSRATADYYWEIHSALTANEIEIPFPQTDLHIKSTDSIMTEKRKKEPL